MSESNITLEDQASNPATDIGVDEILTQPTHDEHEDEVVEVRMAINMSLEQLNAETTEDSSVNDTPIDMKEQAELNQALFLSSLPSEMFDEQLAQLHRPKTHSARATNEFLESMMKAAELHASAIQLFEYFEQSGDCAAIDNVVHLLEEAITLTPDGHADKARCLSNLGIAFQSRFQHLGELRDIENAILVNRQAVDLTPDGHAHKASRLNNLGTAFQSRFERLSELGDIENAILVKRQAVDLTPDGHADKASWLNNLGNAFQRRFERLGELKKISELAPTASNGPVVIVNVADSRCDALVLCSSGDIVHIPLPALSLLRAEELRSNLTSSLRAHTVRIDRNGDRVMRPAKKDNQDCFISVLADLWSDVVQPILSAIEEVLYENTRDSLPHITWCATGPLAFLPLHAAGIYGSDDQTKNTNISDFVVSSYTTTLTTMLGSDSKPKRDPTKIPKVLIVSQPATPGLIALPGTKEEAEAIKKYDSPEGTHCHLTHEAATVETVRNEMCRYEFVHLACHGIQDPKDPLDSAFSLYDGPLKLKALMGLSLENAELAVLSACQTATGDENLPEEAVHLAAGMLAVGYPSVIATMWSIGDKDAPLIADKVYASLLGRCDNSESRKAELTPAYALHEAVKHLRQRVGEMNFVKWVPFIHFGV